jgi:uncharacterized membrane protein
MNAQRLAGLVLLVVGIILLFVGINASNSLADQVSELFRGRFTDRTMWYLIGGAVMSLVGLSLVLVGGRVRT